MRIAIIYNDKKELDYIDTSKIPVFTWNPKSDKYKQQLKEHIERHWQTRQDEIVQIFWMKIKWEYSLNFVRDDFYKEWFYDKVYDIDNERLKY